MLKRMKRAGALRGQIVHLNYSSRKFRQRSILEALSNRITTTNRGLVWFSSQIGFTKDRTTKNHNVWQTIRKSNISNMSLAQVGIMGTRKATRNGTPPCYLRAGLTSKAHLSSSIERQKSKESPTHYMRQFLLQTHPDILQSTKGISEDDIINNEENIARFNALLDEIRSIDHGGEISNSSRKNKALQYPEASRFEFVCRRLQVSEPASDIPHEADLLRINVDFNPPPTSEDVVILNYFYRFLAKLFREAGISISPSIQSSWQRKTEHSTGYESGQQLHQTDELRIPKAMKDIFSLDDIDNEMRQVLGWPMISSKRKEMRRRIDIVHSRK
mmetsp:Transcript_29803/g.41546  ORF Transcript_29803/g.41546 Transcript_29803/m.41546 type:complete len:330 (+) Transcript_29803:71-1060(+)